jgi:hypothetical protein
LKNVLGSLGVIQLCLVCVAADLGATEFDLALVRGHSSRKVTMGEGGSIPVESVLGGVQTFLVKVGPNLFAFGDALAHVSHRLLLVELALLSSARS